MRKLLPRPSIVTLGVALGALVVSLSGVAVATIPAKDGDVHACYSKETGEVVLVESKDDKFDCERNWDGFTWDAEPTKLVSPNGKFTAAVTDQSAKLSGQGQSVTLTPNKVTISGTRIDISASGVVDIEGAQVNVNRR
jgi:hypothetical protein